MSSSSAPQNYVFNRAEGIQAAAEECSTAVVFSIASFERSNSFVRQCLGGDAKEAAFFADANLII